MSAESLMTKARTRGGSKALVTGNDMEASCAYESKQEQLLDRHETRLEDSSITDIWNYTRNSRHKRKHRSDSREERSPAIPSCISAYLADRRVSRPTVY